MRNIFLFLLVIVHLNLNAQKCNNNWCFGDSAGINFDNTINPQTFNCAAKSRGSCCSVSDSLGNLLFYAFTRAAMALKSTRIFNAQNNIMVNGDTIVGEGWYQELVIVPNPIDKNQYYLFSISVTGTSGYGLYYSTIDMSLNNGLGEVTQKNVQLNSLVATDCLNAVKHGNGKDWWIIFRSAKDTQNPNNKFWVYLIDSNGISTPSVQQQGINLNYHSLGNLEFSKSGDKFCHVMAGDRIETYNFDRCTGIITVDKTIDTLNFQNLQYQYYISVQFSPSGRYLYVGQIDTTSYLLQFDLQATNIKASRVIIDSFPFPDYCVGKVKLAPDGKIYLSNWYNDGLNFPYPYPDTTYNIYNTYLSVINDPDSGAKMQLYTI
ncbi:MAG: hypothetical protein IPO27_14990 [Bacteroidetes bacterium]|nr:hypothetical protein [Bacteroidota bacterium]